LYRARYNPRMLRISILIFAFLVIPACALAAPVAKHMRLDQTVEVRPLEDPANPYRTQYQDCDRWVIEHYLATDPDNSFPTEDRFAGYYVLEGYVDESGWLLPQIEVQRLMAAWYQDGSVNPLRDTFPFRFNAAGAMDPALLKATRTAFAQARAPYLPKVPKWLAESPAEWSIILPDGRVVMEAWTRGDEWEPPGFSDFVVPDSSTYGWWLFDEQGNMLAATLPESYWFEATFPAFRAAAINYSQPYLNVIEKYGHIHLYSMDQVAHKTYANFNWDGTPEQANLKLHDRDGNPFLGIHGFDLPIIYAEQQRLQNSAGGL
jgi:hypothetical protein